MRETWLVTHIHADFADRARGIVGQQLEPGGGSEHS